jgi:hypothetical protein
LFLHFRIKTNKIDAYNQLSDAIVKYLDSKLLSSEHSYENQGRNLGEESLTSLMGKVIIMVDKIDSNHLRSTKMEELVNIMGNTDNLNSFRYNDIVYTTDMDALIEHNKTKMTIGYPNLSSISKNYNSSIVMQYGVQMPCMCFQTNDTFLIFGLRGLSDTAIFAIATYVSAILEIPQRSLNSITIPILAESWKNKDMANIKNIYHKSVSNLLAIGLLLFGLVWLNIDNLVAFLNFISNKYGGGYDELPKLIFILGLAKLIDLGTGVNSQIIGTSNYWKFDFYTNLFYIILSIPLNIFLINSYGLEGLAFSNLIALTLYNSIRFGFLYKKFDLQPYTWRHGLFLLSSIALMLLIHMLPAANNFAVNILIQSLAFGIAFYGLAYWINPAPEILNFFNDLFKNKIPGFFKKK